MSVREVRIGLIGCGVVGGGLLKLIEKHRPDFRANGFDLRVTRVAVRDPAKPRDVALGDARVCADPLAVALDPEIDLLVEVMGGATLAVEAGCSALARGVPLVTANKSALARCLSRYLEAAAQGGAAIGFESAVAAHIPIIEALDRSLACEELTLIKGVINGTTNYILTYMERAGCEYEQALADAAAKGFTEADPSLDVDGIDAAEKLALLAYKAFGAFVPTERIPAEGITRIRQIDIRLADALGHRIKLVAAARRLPDGLSLRVHPALIHRGELLADVDSEFNAVILEGPGFKELTFLGKGAGELPTASAVLNDIVKLARSAHGSGALPGFRKSGGEGAALAGAEGLSFCYFLRVPVCAGAEDACLAGLKELGVSVLSQAAVDGHLGIITDTMREQDFLALLPTIAALQALRGEPAFLRLDKDNYRDIVEREQRKYFGASIEREPGAGL
jgi:homoserine dehydrogenase